ncbi:amino acid ABC transporter [Dolosicoccus paucivorans]|uniref:Amino acid ABC transporter n=2 Tax=Dolosicoccus paucivorans TaxID=84521 RepID=A0A2N6SKW6_9LACT|nr:transporter substrate-binding domain-containing protein [Dolosicoccus paucivorans]PMC57155.1 amino acid ABC transporter [Dolosicoccus paucivorans]
MKKIVKVMLSLMVLVLVLPAQLVSAKSDVESIQKKGKIVFGTSAEFPPFEWVIMKDGKEEIVGVDVDLAQKIADELGVELEVNNMGFDSLIQSLKAGKIDMILAGMNENEERAKQVDFSIPYYESETYIVVPKDKLDTVTKPEDLEGLKVGTQKASVQETYLKESGIQMDIVSMPKNGTLVEALKAKKLDAIVMDSITVGEFLRKNEDVLAKVPNPIPGDGAGQCVAVNKGNETLLEVVNKVVKEAVEKDEIKQSIEKNLDLATSKE